MATDSNTARLIVLLVLASSLALPGCYSRLTGNAGEFTFGYMTDVELENFNKPLAPGSSLDLVAFENGTEDTTLEIVSARSSEPDVLTVTSTTDERARLEAGSPGEARIEITARKSDGTEVKDAVYMSVAEPSAVDLDHSCTDAEMAAYIASEKFAVPYTMASDDGRTVIGEGYVPVEPEPSGSVRYLGKPRGQSWLYFLGGPPADRMRLRSKVDDTSLWMRLVRRSDIDHLRPTPASERARTVVGMETAVAALPFAGDDPVCQAKVMTRAKSLTPDICGVSADLDGDGSDWNRDQLALVEGRAFGVCRAKMTLPEAAGGDGLSYTFEVPVGEFPDEETSTAQSDGDSDLPWYLAPLLALLAPLLLGPLWWRRSGSIRC
ncbi:MAG: hypothetical protein ACOCV2_00925 [Persicimonas sp.]